MLKARKKAGWMIWRPGVGEHKAFKLNDSALCGGGGRRAQGAGDVLEALGKASVRRSGWCGGLAGGARGGPA